MGRTDDFDTDDSATMTRESDAPLSGLLVLDLCQFLSGPYASLRLQDLGARVIKIERPGVGDLCRQIYLSDTQISGESTIFHAINRSKESLALDLKDAADLARLKRLIARADVFMQNFRPGVIRRLGLDYDAVRAINPSIVYSSITGYGETGPWSGRPGQDLLAQALSGVMWLNGSAGDGPVPFGLAVADMLAGANAAHGILAALVRRGLKGRGAHVETSLLEAMVDFQFEVLATHMNDGGRPPQRAAYRSAHPGLAAPYGVYPTRDGYIAIAMAPIGRLIDLLHVPALEPYRDTPDTWFKARDAIKIILGEVLVRETTDHWCAILEPEDVWCAKVLGWDALVNSPAFQCLDMVQALQTSRGASIQTTRSPIRIDGSRAASTHAGPSVGQHTQALCDEFDLD